MKLSFENPLFRFLVTALVLYIGWFSLYNLVLDPQDSIDQVLTGNLVFLGEQLLEGFGYHLIAPSPDAKVQTLGIDGSTGLWIGDPCNGMTLFALFTIFVISYPGPIKRKLWFIPVGILAIHFMNFLRVIGLVLINYYSPESLEFNHNYTFTTIVYSFVFFLWYLWAEKLSKTPTDPENPTPHVA